MVSKKSSLKIDQGAGCEIVIPEDPFENLRRDIAILWKCEFDPTDIINFVEKTLEGFEE